MRGVKIQRATEHQSDDGDSTKYELILWTINSN